VSLPAPLPLFAPPSPRCGPHHQDSRFLRIHLVKSVLPAPETNVDAVMQAVHTLNTVTVPMGQQMGTDSGKGEGEGDHTQWGVVYDHKLGTIYWRTETNHNLQRLRLADAHLDGGSARHHIKFSKNSLPWFNDAKAAFVI
jgi:penicillin V acylase-like amidase (Ntn superfamily)